MKLKRFLTVAIVAVMSLAGLSLNSASAAGTYSISCKNDAYGMQLGFHYTSVMYVYRSAMTLSQQDATVRGQYLNDASKTGAYVGNDCLYAGAADTNGTAVVAGDVARMAVNAIVGAVSNRIDMAYASQEKGASATGLSFTTQNDGIAMSANRIIGGLSFWADMANSEFQNTQEYTSLRLDSMKFDGSGTSYSMGIDKTFGKAIVGVVLSNYETDITTTFNSGTYKQNVDTMGLYIAYRTKMIQIDLGMGEGDSEINTTRKDFGNDKTITGKTTADITYENASISATFTRGKFSLVPKASYRSIQMDIKKFTDFRPSDDAATVVGGAATIFSTNNATLTTTDDHLSARSVASETVDVGVSLSADLGKVIPYINYTYSSEDTTRANYKHELQSDGNQNENQSTNYQSSSHLSGGISFYLGSHVTGGIRAGNIMGRDDWKEDYVAGNISLGF
jgi:hypothetical protein